jgi:hypothetical protein
MTTLHDIMETCGAFNGDEAEKWIGELTEVLAKVECKRRVNLPDWGRLNALQKQDCRDVAQRYLTAMVDFFQSKLDAEAE